MAQTRIILELSASRVEAAVLRGQTVTAQASERMGRSEWPQPYTTALPEVQGAVARVLEKLGLTKATATVIYHTPGSVSTVTSCAVNVSEYSGEQAARLALGSIADFPLDDAPLDTCVLMTDAKSKGSGKGKGKEKPAEGPANAQDVLVQRHYLAAADAEQRAVALTAALSAAGIDVERLVTADAVALTAAVRGATGQGNKDTGELLLLEGTTTAIIWIGEHSTALAVGGPGRLQLVRSIATGSEALTDALCRPMRSRDPEAATVKLNHEESRQLLLRTGVPTADAVIEGYPTLAGSSMLPHMQPVLQRLGIEIKQSLRFGVAEAQRGSIRIRLCGPGAGIPGLADALGRLSGHALFAPTSVGGAEVPTSSKNGLIRAYLECAESLTLSLAPQDVRDEQTHKRVRKALIAGCAIAALFVGWEGADAHLRLQQERSKLASLRQQSEQTDAMVASRQVILNARKAVSDAETRVRTTMGESPDWAALLVAFSQQSPEAMRVQTMDMSRDGGKAKLLIRGYVPAILSDKPSDVIRGFVSTLAKLPVVDEVKLGSIQRSQQSGGEAQAFDLTVTPVSLPVGLTIQARDASASHASVPTGTEVGK